MQLCFIADEPLLVILYDLIMKLALNSLEFFYNDSEPMENVIGFDFASNSRINLDRKLTQ